MSRQPAQAPDLAVSRRQFVKAAAGSAIAIGAATRLQASSWVTGREVIRVGVIGCGGRGTGAAYNALEADPAVRIIALADLFPDRVSACREQLAKDFADRATVTPEMCFNGFDACKHLLAAPVDYVILATPPGFRPAHFEAAVAAGKHVFMEKPVAVDPAGVRRVLASAAEATRKNLSVVAGTQRRHEHSYLEAIARLRDGAIGDVVSASCYWNQGGLWVHDRRPEYTDVEWMCRNWLYFDLMSGDHICEQHIHNLDVINWVMDATPAKAMGMGGRQVRTHEKYGNIFDHFAIEYTYPSGHTMLSMCRQIDGCADRVEESVVGSKGSLLTRPNFAIIKSDGEWRAQRNPSNPYTQEHIDLIASIRGSGSHLNEAVRVAESTLTAIMGRMSAYTGKEVTWKQAMESQLKLMPDDISFGDFAASPVPTPGQTALI